ncbi:MAG: hypothetical protein D6771_05205 [Zetaproteobacteria bacterium]|nr:MAG: hypothetical protein D6771_05205 [Zetaproteobacteria bacterium]
MRNTRNALGLMLAGMMLGAGLAQAADSFLGIPRFKGVKPLKDRTYQEACGECHFAYFPGLLPARSWKRLMEPKNLENHFGENAELDEEDRRYI